MEYSVESLAKLSGVSIRTLYYYDEIELLKPTIRMASGRRYYGTEALFTLLEILFFKEIGFNLKKIKSILGAPNVNKSEQLLLQKKCLMKEIKRLKNLVQSVDRTIIHYQGCKMSNKEIAKQFDNRRSKIDKIFEEEYSKKKWSELKEEAKKVPLEKAKEYYETSKGLTEEIIQAIHQSLEESSLEVQAIMKKQYEFGCQNNPELITKESYLKGREFMFKLYNASATLHPKLADFVYKAMGIFAEANF